MATRGITLAGAGPSSTGQPELAANPGQPWPTLAKCGGGGVSVWRLAVLLVLLVLLAAAPLTFQASGLEMVGRLQGATERLRCNGAQSHMRFHLSLSAPSLPIASDAKEQQRTCPSDLICHLPVLWCWWSPFARSRTQDTKHKNHKRTCWATSTACAGRVCGAAQPATAGDDPAVLVPRNLRISLQHQVAAPPAQLWRLWLPAVPALPCPALPSPPPRLPCPSAALRSASQPHL